MTAANCLPEPIAKGRGWNSGALLLMFGYTGHEHQINWEEKNLYALLERTGCIFLPACFPKTKEPKFNTEVYDSSLCYSFPLLILAHP